MTKLKVKVKAFGLLDILNFVKNLLNRNKTFKNASDKAIDPLPPSNELSKLRHPKFQKVIISDIETHSPDIKTFTLKAKNPELPLAYARAGQYIGIYTSVGKSQLMRPISLCSAPSTTEYKITIKRSVFLSNVMLDEWQTGLELLVTAPEGNFYYEPIRDEKKVIGIAGGSGITPFLAMAESIAKGIEDFYLTIIYGCRTRNDKLFEKQLLNLSSLTEKVKIVFVLSEDEEEGCETGFISKDIIEKYAPVDEKYSVFVCGPQAMYNFVKGEAEKLSLDNKHFRRELFGEVKQPEKRAGYPEGNAEKVFSLKVKAYGEVFEMAAKGNESLLVAMERAGLSAPARCRSGECGFCRSKLISGDVFVPEDVTGVRIADKRFGYIHPCCSYPVSDIELDVPLN